MATLFKGDGTPIEEATAVIADGSVTKPKLADALLEELGLSSGHLTEEAVPVYISGYASWTPSSGASGTRCTQLFKTPRYVRVKNVSNVNAEFYRVRLANEGDMDSGSFSEAAADRNLRFMKAGTVAPGEEVTVATDEYGRKGREYMQLMFNVSGSYGTRDLLEVTAIYDDRKPVYTPPSEGALYTEDLPMRWVYQGDSNVARAALWCVVPYYPGFTYSISGGNMPTIKANTVQTVYLLDDSIFTTYDLGMTHTSGTVGYIPLIKGMTAVQYDTTVNGGANASYNWTYHTTPPEAELTGPKWVAFNMGVLSQEQAGDMGIEYYNALILEKNNSSTRNQYVTRWPEKAPRRILSTLVRKSESLQDEGTHYTSLLSATTNPLARAKWVLFGDSLTDNYGGKDHSSDYFASKIAREFGMKLDNRAKSGSNIYAGGSGNYTSVSGIVMLDAYLAEVEAGTAEQADYITVAFGTNTYKAQLGTMADTSDTKTSVYGAAKYFIEKIREKVPNAVLGFVLSPRQDWGSFDPNGTRDIDGGRAAIKAVCEEYGVHYMDMSKESGITVGMLPDGIHISSEQSQKLYYHAMRRFMLGL